MKDLGEVNCLAVCTGGGHFVSGGWQGAGKLRLHETATGKEVMVLTTEPDDLLCLLLRPDGRALLTCDADGRLLVVGLPKTVVPPPR